MQRLTRNPKDIGHAIREVRKAKNLTQKDLARLSGVWQETISKTENGVANTQLETLFDLLAALDLEITIAERSKGSTADIEDIF
jgi:HTH-type transcriptional regulator/antitoxin HipB